jgi:DNA invertase Pin-like site-specific DNA recombinase
MAIYRYIRYSGDKQDEQSQNAIIDRWCNSKGIVCDDTIMDEAISGKAGTLNKRALQKLLDKLESGDTLIVSELSRITRAGIGELVSIVETYLKPRKIRFVLCNYNLDINCSSIDPITELMLVLMATFAKIERDSLITRTTAALEARKELIKKNGGFVSKSGRWCTSLGNPRGDRSEARLASISSRTNAKIDWQMNSPLARYLKSRWAQGWSFVELLEDGERMFEIDPKTYCTSRGCKINRNCLSGLIKLWSSGKMK